MKKILVITPDLSLNGANVVLLELLELLKDVYSFHVLSSKEGLFGESLKEIGISYEVRATVQKNSISTESYDAVFLNTSSVHFYALAFQNKSIPVHWWFHESYEQLSQSRDNFVHLGLLSDNFHFYGVTPKVIRGLHELYGITADILPMPVQDQLASEQTAISTDKLTIFIPGAYTYIKGQDLLLAAIAKLPPEYRQTTEFVFAGYKLPAQEEYYNKLHQMADLLPNVTLLDSISREAVYSYYQKAICVIAPSRVDSTPTTIVEALMHQKICIVSSGAGISELMTDCLNGLVFPSDNIDELYKRLLLVLTGYQELTVLAENGRKLYEEFFSTTVIKPLTTHYLNAD